MDGEFDAFFAGDIGSEEEDWIAAHFKEWMEETNGIDFYKVTHHGSKYSNSYQILKVLNPKIAVISCGMNNRYGHPHSETLERIESIGSEIFSTAKGGQITVEINCDRER